MSRVSLSSIQNHIISRLKNADTLRFRDMRPEDVPQDLYNYHLKMLMTKQLVGKTAEGYSLTHEGRRFVADAYHTSDQANRLFKINVITIVSRIHEGKIEILNQRRHSQPSFGKVGVMGGTIVKGEPLLEGARRKLENETGLRAEFRQVGQERRMRYVQGELFSDVLFPICYASLETGELHDTEYGHNFWVSIDQAIQNEQNPHDSIAAITTVLEAIRDGQIDSLPFFYQETTQSDS